MHNVNWDIINKHKQLYDKSCIPSCIEMILKLEGAVTPSYDAEQIKHGNNGGLCFGSYHSKNLSGLTFHHEFTEEKGPQFPLSGLYSKIKVELAAGRYVAISLASGSNWHMWVIYEDTGKDFLAFSKSGPDTIFQSVWSSVLARQGADILTYSR